MSEKPTCFVAMAFGKEDTEKLYDNLMLPVLNKLNIRPVIINRQESNDDLNLQIIEELEKCDFAIADLTYARPSVYFEAGFAQRAVEVIYTVRADHLKNSQPDALRVHFDLQMKNLITWSGTEDSKFSEKLTRRIEKTFLKKWNQKETENTKIKLEESELKTLPLIDVLAFVRKTAIDMLLKIGYKKWYVNNGSLNDNSITQPEDKVLAGRYNNVYSIRKSKSEIKLASVSSFDSATKDVIKRIMNDYDDYSLRKLIGELLNEGTNVTINHYIFSLRSIPDSRIKGLLYYFYKSPDDSMYSCDSDIDIYRKKLKIPVKTTFHFISNITGITKFKNELNNHLKKNIH